MNIEKNLTESLQSELAELNELGRAIQGEMPEPTQLTQLLVRLRRVHARVQELHNRAIGCPPPHFGDNGGYFRRQPHAVS
jgi:hypothetical protein